MSAINGRVILYKDLENPLARIIYESSESYELKSKDSYNPMADYFKLSDSERKQKLKDGRWKE